MKLVYKTDLSVTQIQKIIDKKAYRDKLLRAVLIALNHNQPSVLVYNEFGRRFKLLRSRTGLKNPILRGFYGSFSEHGGKTEIKGIFRPSVLAIGALTLWFGCVLAALGAYIFLAINKHVFEAKPFLIVIGLLLAGVLVTCLALRSSKKDEKEVIKFIEQDLKAVRVLPEE